ncbi:Transforming growth factor, beta receptor III [Chamberlinius hualienensis]
MKFKKKLVLLVPQLSFGCFWYNWLMSSVLFGVAFWPVNAGNFCEVKTAFNLPAVVPMWEEEISVVGCFSNRTTLKGQEVHVLHLKTIEGWPAPKVVTVHIRPADDYSIYKKPLILLLHSEFTVSWKLVGERLNNSTYHQVIVTDVSQVIENRDMQLNIRRRFNGKIKRLLVWLNKRFKTLTSYAKIEGANYIRLKLGVKNGEVATACDVNSRRGVPHVTAFSQDAIPVINRKGCVARCNYRASNSIVHIIKINETHRSSFLRGINRVKVNINSRMNHSPDRNVTLILHTSLPAEWTLISDGTKGPLNIITEGNVITPKNILSPKMQVHIKHLPNNTNDLMSDCVNWFGPSFTYTEIQRANLVRIFVDGSDEEAPPPKLVEFYSTNVLKPRAIAGNRDMVRSHLRHGHTTRVGSETHILANSKRPMKANDIIRMPSVMLYDVMVVECLPQHMRVSFPRISMEQLGLQPEHITLIDSRCTVSVNNTHYVLSSSVDDCGTKKSVNDDKVIYKNAIHFHFQMQKIGSLYSSWPEMESTTLPIDDEDGGETGSGSSGIPDSSEAKTLEFQCDYLHQDSSFQIKGPSLSSSLTASRELFSMKLARDPGFIKPITSREYPLLLVEQELIYVETRFNAGNLQVVTGDCWLSENDDPKATMVNKLITNGCPTGPSVQLESRKDSVSNRFSFILDTEYTKYATLFLHCKLGICSSAKSHGNKRSLKLCIDPEYVCKTDVLKSYMEVSGGTHQNIFSRGPFTVNKRPKNSLTNVPFTKQGKLDVEVLGGQTIGVRCTIPEPQSVIIIGLSTETVVGIAFTTFLIGLGLAAVLWCIYVKTDPLRNIHNHPSRHHSGFDLSGHSGSSTPNSQSPMTT